MSFRWRNGRTGSTSSAELVKGSPGNKFEPTDDALPKQAAGLTAMGGGSDGGSKLKLLAGKVVNKHTQVRTKQVKKSDGIFIARRCCNAVT